MPEVGFDNKPIRYDLKTAPPDGYVDLRRLPYDDILRRREMATSLSMEQTSQRSRRNSRQDRQQPKREETQKIGIELAQIKTREYEFAACIVDHNLDVGGVRVDFSKPKLAFRMVAPEVLQEIELHLSELNMETDEDEVADFTPAAPPSSLDSERTLKSITDET